MKTIATATLTTDVPAGAFFARWADMATWPAWNTDTEWVRLAGPLAFLWNLVLGRDIAEGLAADLARLEAAARAAGVPA